MSGFKAEIGTRFDNNLNARDEKNNKETPSGSNYEEDFEEIDEDIQ